MMQKTVKIAPERARSLPVKVLLVKAMRLGGVEIGRRKEHEQQQVTGKSNTKGLILLDKATPITTGSMMLAEAVLEVNMPIKTIMHWTKNTARYYKSMIV